MPKQSRPLRFDAVLAQLETLREQTTQNLRAPEKHETALALKRQLNDAIACLRWCKLHQISPLAQVTVLPETQMLSNDYRIVEDNETENREDWIVLREDGVIYYAHPGDIIIRKP